MMTEQLNITDVTTTMDRRLTPSKSNSRFNGEDSVVIKDSGWQYSGTQCREIISQPKGGRIFQSEEGRQDQNLY
jgi:hypothetical protein